MDEIYDNLENYNEENELAELRCENKKLKVKLEEYSTSIEKLQKDMDTVQFEFKKLEFNYSSLLKTARAEIERKTQMITNINIEKDMLICKALQNGNNSVINFKRQIAANQSMKKNTFASSNKPKKDKKKCNIDNERNYDRIASSDYKSGTDYLDSERKPRNIVSTSMTNFDSCQGKSSESKESRLGYDNVSKITNKPKVLNIKDRRKSMPAERLQDSKFSSDEECNKSSGHTKEYIKDNIDRNPYDRRYNSKYHNKVSECSSIEDRTSGYHESSRETYNSKNSRYYDSEKYKSKDKYQSSRHRKDCNSPDRYNKRTRDYKTESNQRLEYSKGRVLESPPNDKYISRKHSSHRSNYHRSQHNDQERYTHHQDRYPVKQKIPFDNDEPFSKRKKINPCNDNENTELNQREFIKNQGNNDNIDELESQYTSCQSPDYIHTDMSEPIKEIMNIAVTQLEDPRITSKKYFLQTCAEKTYLSTLKDNNIGLRVIDKSNWGIEIFSTRTDLHQKHIEEESLEHMSVDEPVVNISKDSSGASYQPHEFVNDDKNEYVKYQPTKSYPVNDYRKCGFINTIEGNTHSEEIQQKMLYNSPITKTTHNDSRSIQFIKNKEYSDISENSNECYNNSSIHKENRKGFLRKSPLQVTNYHNLNEDINNRDISFYDTKQSFKDNYYLTVTESQSVENDLELSDESCDNTVIHKDNLNNSATNKTYDSCKSLEKETERRHEENNELNTREKASVSKEKAFDRCNDPDKEHKSDDKLENFTKLNSDRKLKNKKKTHKSKDKVCTEKIEQIVVAEKRIKPKVKKEKRREEKEKKEMEKPKEVKLNLNLSSENSLITPDDLGISVQSKKQCTSYKSSTKVAQNSINFEKQNLTLNDSRCNEFIDAMYSNVTSEEKNEKGKEFITNCNDNNQMDCDETITSKLLYENLENFTKDNDAVKTVIISTGSQPYVPTENEDLVKITQNNSHINQETCVNALATSTPLKHSMLNNDLGTNSPGLSNKASHINFKNDTTNRQVETQTASDAPDVRIFVRRKRKVLKKDQ